MKHYHEGFSLRSLIQSFKNAGRGFSVLLKNEYNLYIQLCAGLILVILGFIFSISLTEWSIQIIIIGFVIISELINTAIEKTMDLVQPEYDERVRDIKDLSAATVLFAVFVAVLSALCIYIPKIISLFS